MAPEVSWRQPCQTFQAEIYGGSYIYWDWSYFREVAVQGMTAGPVFKNLQKEGNSSPTSKVLRFALLHPSELWLEFSGSTFVFRSVKAVGIFLEYKIKSFTQVFKSVCPAASTVE